jgi:AAA domain
MSISLASLRRGPQHKAPRIVLHGTHGIGKSTLGASAPGAVFIPTEDGTDVLDVTSFPIATSEQDVLDAIGVLIAEEHEFQTVVIDTADWLENLIWRAVASEKGSPTIEGTGERGDPLGYGKGYRFALEHWRQILEGLDLLRNEKSVMPIILAHSQIKRFDDPTTSSYDRYMLDLHTSAAALLCEWADIVGFLNYRVSIKETDVGFNRRVVKGKSGGDRILYLEERPGFIAKSRYDLPDELAIPKVDGWQTLEAEISKAIAKPELKNEPKPTRKPKEHANG